MSSAKTYAEIRKKRIEKYLRDYGEDTKAKATAKALHTVKLSSDEKAAFRKTYIAANGVPKSKEALAAYRRALQEERARREITYEQEAKDAGVNIDKIRQDARDKFKKALERDKKLKEERDAAIQAMIEAEGYDERAPRPSPSSRPAPYSRPSPADTESKTDESDASEPGYLARAASYVPFVGSYFGGGESEEAKAAREEKEKAARELAAAQKEAKRQAELLKQAEEKAKKEKDARTKRILEKERRQQAQALAAAKKAEQDALAAEKALAEAAAAKRKAEELKRQAAEKEAERLRIAAEQKALAEKAAQKEREERERIATERAAAQKARQAQAQARQAPADTSSTGNSKADEILAKYGPNGPGYDASDNPLKTMLDNGDVKESLKELAVRLVKASEGKTKKEGGINGKEIRFFLYGKDGWRGYWAGVLGKTASRDQEKLTEELRAKLKDVIDGNVSAPAQSSPLAPTPLQRRNAANQPTTPRGTPIESSPAPVEDDDGLDSMEYKDLRTIAKSLGVRANLSKVNMIKGIRAARQGGATPTQAQSTPSRPPQAQSTPSRPPQAQATSVVGNLSEADTMAKLDEFVENNNLKDEVQRISNKKKYKQRIRKALKARQNRLVDVEDDLESYFEKPESASFDLASKKLHLFGDEDFTMHCSRRVEEPPAGKLSKAIKDMRKKLGKKARKIAEEVAKTVESEMSNNSIMLDGYDSEGEMLTKPVEKICPTMGLSERKFRQLIL